MQNIPLIADGKLVREMVVAILTVDRNRTRLEMFNPHPKDFRRGILFVDNHGSTIPHEANQQL